MPERNAFGLGATASFILLNGFVIAAITFGLLFFTMGDLKNIEMRKVTRDVVSATEKSIEETEKTASSLAYLHSTLTEIEATSSMRQLLTGGDTKLTGALWRTSEGDWHWENFVGREGYRGPVTETNMPSFQELYKAAFELEEGEVGYLGRLPWPAFSSDKRSVGLVVKMRLASGGIGVLLAVTTPGKIFGNAWTSSPEEISQVVISGDGSATNEEAVLEYFSGRSVASGIFPPEKISYALRLGKTGWTMVFHVQPSQSSKMLTVSPFLAVLFIVAFTIAASAMAERKSRQDAAMAEMSRSLEGVHSELQTRISERDRLFHALRKSERENRAVINSVSDIIFETDESGRIVFLNETWRRVTGHEIEAGLEKNLFLMIHADDRRRQKEMFEELVRGERQAYRSETQIDVGDGRYKPVEIAFSMLRMTEDKSLRVVGTVTDIEKRRRAELAVREAEQRFRAIFENSVSGIYQISPEGRFISANPAMADILGYASADDLIASVMDVSSQIYVRPEDRKAVLQRLLFEGKVSGVETEAYRRDGQKIWLLENARVVRNANGGVSYYEGSAWDVTERKEAEEAMKQARIQAEMSSRSKMEFLANMSHELRTPLNAVIGFSEIIKDEVMGPLGVPSYKEYAQDIYDSGNYLLKIISEILEVSKIETGNRELNISTVRLEKSMRSCMTIMAGRIEQSGVDVRLDIPDDLPDMLAEELGFKQIMLNLIGNAIKFTEKGGRVAVSAVIAETGDLVIDVTDTGIGMTAEEIKKAMQPFVKVDTSFNSMKAGTGLGLTIVDSLVKLHGGTFTLISEKGVGTTARVVMPASRLLHKGVAARSV